MRYLPWLNILLLLIIILDFYLIPQREIQEKLSEQTFQNNRTSITRSYNRYTIITETGNKYNLPETLYGWLKLDSVFVIGKTAILRIPATIYFQTNGEQYSMRIGHFNSNIIIQGILTMVLIMSVLELTKKTSAQVFGISLLLYTFCFTGFSSSLS
jgi:hypothetical protein